MKIAVLPGDGIGPEIVTQAKRVLTVLAQDGLPIEMEDGVLGGAAYDRYGHPYPDATQKLVHDFSSFRAAECQARTPVKNLQTLNIIQHQGLIRFDLMADAFLHHMVRNMVGALVYVGKGKLSVQGMQDLLAVRDRTAAPPTFMPDGLYLTGVGYPDEFNLPAAAEPCRLSLWR